MRAVDTLAATADALKRQASIRDTPDGERSMERIVAAFNGATGHTLTVAEGWAFMVQLKLVRGLKAPDNADTFADLCGYGALMGEGGTAKPEKPMTPKLSAWINADAPAANIEVGRPARVKDRWGCAVIDSHLTDGDLVLCFHEGSMAVYRRQDVQVAL